MQVRPFKLLGAAELAHVEARVAAAVEGWCGEWLAAGVLPDVRCSAAADVSERGSNLHWLSVRAGSAAVHVGQGSERRSSLDGLLFGRSAASQPSALAAEVTRRALAALAVRCLAGAEPVQGPGAGPAAHDWQRGSGAVAAVLAWPSVELRLLLDGEAIARWLAGMPRRAAMQPTPLSDPRGAIGQSRVELQASTGNVDIDVATLHSLAVGDVLSLDLRIDQPLRLTIGGQPTTRRAYLGSQAGRRALSLTAATEPLPPRAQEPSHVRSPE